MEQELKKIIEFKEKTGWSTRFLIEMAMYLHNTEKLSAKIKKQER